MRLILLTKYNTAIPGMAGRPGLNARWLAQRLALFDEWTLPAVGAQSRRPDAWLVFVDADTDQSYLQALRDRLAGLGTLVPVSGALTDPRIGEIVAGAVEPGSGALLSARLDSDDAVGVSYLERMGAAAVGWRGFVNAPLGYRVCDERVLLARERSGPFLGFVEEPGPGRPLTVFQVPHSEAAGRAPVRQLRGRPAWIQVVHGGNLANAFHGWPADARRCPGGHRSRRSSCADSRRRAWGPSVHRSGGRSGPSRTRRLCARRSARDHRTGRHDMGTGRWVVRWIGALALLVATCSAQAAEYKLGLQDKVRIEVYEYPAVDGEYEVGAAGTVALPLVGEVAADGATPGELAERINARLAGLSRSAAGSSASVQVTEYRPIFILGDVQQPGPYPFQPGLRMVQALALAGGVYRPQDLGALRISRDAIAAAGLIEVLEARALGLSAERARLEAELSGADTVSFPEEAVRPVASCGCGKRGHRAAGCAFRRAARRLLEAVGDPRPADPVAEGRDGVAGPPGRAQGPADRDR